MKKGAVELMVTICMYCKAIAGCCVHGSCVLTKDVCDACDQGIYCRIRANVERLADNYKTAGLLYPVEEAVKDVTGAPPSHGICNSCLENYHGGSS